ncbi:MAG: hypothetical protein WC349_04270 [Patescibacteria group bacterium]|jgi:hypothetical protein
MENLDSRLLRNQEEEREAAQELKSQRSGVSNETEDTSGSGSLRERAMQARQALNIKEQAKKKIEEKVTAPAKMATGRALQWAWMTLIPSFGLSLIYINMHVFLRWVFPDAFCKLGEEWIPKTVAPESSKNIGGTAFGIVEIMGLLFIDLLLLFIILGVLGIFLLMCDIIQNPLSYIGEALGIAWNAVTGFFTGK